MTRSVADRGLKLERGLEGRSSLRPAERRLGQQPRAQRLREKRVVSQLPCERGRLTCVLDRLVQPPPPPEELSRCPFERGGAQAVVVARLLGGLQEEIGGRGQVVGVGADAGQAREDVRARGPGLELRGGFFEEHDSAPAVTRLEVVVAGRGDPAEPALGKLGRGQLRGLLAQAGGHGRRAAGAGAKGTLVEPRGNPLVGPGRGSREVVGALDRVGHDLGKPLVNLSPPSRIGGSVRARRKQRVEKAHAAVIDRDEPCGLRRVEGACAHHVVDERAGRLRRSRGHEQPALRLLRKRLEAVVNEDLQGRRQRLGVQHLRRAGELEREERVAARELVDAV